MSTRTLYLARHGAADALGTLTDEGREQSRRLGLRLAEAPFDAIWHSPLPRAVESAEIIARKHPGVLLDEAPELVDHIPHVPPATARSGAWVGFFDGYSTREAEAGARTAASSVRRFAHSPGPGRRSTRELLVTHAYPVAWLVRHVLGAPPAAWMSLAGIANTGLTIVDLPEGELASIRCVNDVSHLDAPDPTPLPGRS